MSTTRETRKAQIEAWTLEHFLKTGQDVTVKEIASGIGIAESTVRKYVDFCDFASYKDSRVSESKNYPGMEAGVHLVWMYGPSRSLLRSRINGG